MCICTDTLGNPSRKRPYCDSPNTLDNHIEYDMSDIKQILQSFVKKRTNILTETQPVIASLWTHYMDMYIERFMKNLSQLNDITTNNHFGDTINEETIVMAYILYNNVCI